MATGTDLVPAEKYAALAIDEAELDLVIEENLKGQTITEFDLDRVRMPSGGGLSWAVPTLEGEESEKTLQGVIVYFKDVRSFWKKEYSGGSEPPDCSSPDAVTADPNGDPGEPVPTDEHGRFICAQCPNAAFGSGKEGAQACKLGRQIFLLTPENLLPIVVALPPTSVAEAKRYFLRLASRGVPYSTVITRIGLEKSKSGGGIDYSRATFELGGRLEGAEAERVRNFAQKLRPAFERSTLQGADLEGTAVEA